MITSRVEKLRQQSLQAENRISSERALLVTDFYKSKTAVGQPAPVQRGHCLLHIFQHKSICINPGELIVGERGPAPKATPTYPEVTLHSLHDLEVLHNRPKVSFKSDESVRQAYRDVVIPFWEGKTHRDRMMNRMTPEWKKAYAAGIFTEFQEQRAPGHTVLGSKMWNKGMLDILNDIEESRRCLDYHNDPSISIKLDELEGMELAAQALIKLADRHADELDRLAEASADSQRKIELQQMAAICRKVPAHAPETLHEALQHYWFIHLGVITELNPWDSFNPGRIDQHLLPFYQRDLAEGRLDREQARELLHCFWIKFNNHPAPPKIGVTALESNTYTDFALINLGGVKTDGSDAVNELTYLLLEVIQEMRLLQPSSMVQISKKNPDRLIHKTLDITRTGFGQPSLFNTDAIVQELMRQGKSPEDARHGGASGCVESGAFGTEAYILTGYFNLTKIFELTLHNGFDKRTGQQAGIASGDLSTLDTFDRLMKAFKEQVNYFVDMKIKGNNLIEGLFATHLPAPFLSLLIDDCIANARDYNAGGARYNTSYLQGVGLGSLTDSLTAIKLHVYDRKTLTLESMVKALDNNFADYEELRRMLVFKTPKWGNDDDTADNHAVEIFNIFFNAVDGRPSPRGATYRINMLPTTCHIYFGQVTGATPDGRLAGTPLSEGISPVQGADQHGPSAVVRSAAKIDHIKTGGTLLNQKFTPSFFDDPESYKKLTALIRSYFRMDGHHIQFNVVSADTLRDARQHPEKYRDLIVRVAGYSDYFNDLGEDLQEEIIRRTEHHGD